MVEALKAFPADVGRLCIPRYVYTMIMVMQRGGWLGIAGRAGPDHRLQRPCRWVPRDGTLTPCAGPAWTCLDFATWAFQAGDSQGSKGEAGAAAAGGAAFVKQLGLSQSHTSSAPKVNFGVDWVTGTVEGDAGAGDAGASTFCMGEGILQLLLVVSRSMSSLEELSLELVHDWKLWGMTTATSKRKQ